MEQLEIRTPQRACMIDITSRVRKVVEQSGVQDGICYVFCPHTTAGLTINENADPTVQSDILKELDKIVPWRDDYAHFEGNSAAHIKVSLMGASQNVFIHGGRLQLGTWQGIYLCEFDGPRHRNVWVKVVAG
jgi:secondary thiamine-phosphate synthase enzyme